MENSATEEKLLDALKQHEAGRPLPEILRVAREYKQDIEELLETAEMLRRSRELIRPPESALRQCLAQLDTVATSAQARDPEWADSEEGTVTKHEARRSHIKSVYEIFQGAIGKAALTVGMAAVLGIVMSAMQFGRPGVGPIATRITVATSVPTRSQKISRMPPARRSIISPLPNPKFAVQQAKRVAMPATRGLPSLPPIPKLPSLSTPALASPSS